VPKVQRTRGRPSEYDDEFIPEAVSLAAAGATDAEIADGLGIDRSTLRRWFLAYPQLNAAVKAAKDTIDQRVERSLFKRAVEDGDTTAHIFWLKNRRPLEWRDRKETEIIVPDPGQDAEQLDTRGAALAALALFTEAQYDPRATGVLLDATANAEEKDDGEEPPTYSGRGLGNRAPSDDGRSDGARAPDPSDDDWETGVDLDPGEL
jgi:hypothetical protein